MNVPAEKSACQTKCWVFLLLRLSKMRRLMEVGLCGGPTDLLRRHIVRVRADSRISPDTRERILLLMVFAKLDIRLRRVE